VIINQSEDCYVELCQAVPFAPSELKVNKQLLLSPISMDNVYSRDQENCKKQFSDT